MSDLKKTLASLSRAKIGATLPLDEIEQRSDERDATKRERERRRAKRENLTHLVRGRLVFSSTLGSDTPKPIPLIRVELWDRDFDSPDDYLGAAETDAEGRFVIRYDPADAGLLDKPDLELRVIDSYNGKQELLYICGATREAEGEVVEYGDVGVPYYEYHPGIPLPHVLTFEFGKQKLDAMPQVYRVGRKMALAAVASSVYEVRLKHYTVAREASVQEIQADYVGKTSYNPPTGLGPEASADEAFVYKLLNGAVVTQFSEFEGQYHVVHNWDAYEMDGTHYLPNVHAVFDHDAGQLTPASITIQSRIDNATAPHSPLAEPQTYRPGDAEWVRAKHVFDCANYMHAQAANHLARGHFNAEQFALAAWRNLRRSPLRELLFPHLQEVMIINVEGESAIFGPEGIITKNGALTEHSLSQAIVDRVDTDWYGWKPRAPLGPTHDFAHVANIYWDALGEYVDWFFSTHLDDILATWDEARGFSDDLVAHSVPYRPLPLPEGHRHVDANEQPKPDAPRVEVEGELRSMTPIVTRAEADEQQVLDLAQACRYAIFHATFWHGWVNDTSDALEPSYAQYNPIDQSTTKELSNHISVNLALSQTRYGMIMRNEDGDIPEPLIAALQARSAAFAKHGFDPRLIRSRINI